jgi:hypothetical protein
MCRTPAHVEVFRGCLVAGLGDDCEYTSNCSAEQLCLIWGLRCDLVTPGSTSDSLLTAPAQATYNDSAGT